MRCELDAALRTSDASAPQTLLVKALNEYDVKSQVRHGGPEGRSSSAVRHGIWRCEARNGRPLCVGIESHGCELDPCTVFESHGA